MKLEKYEKREKARHKKKHAPRADGRSVLLIQEILNKKSEKAKKKRKGK